MTAKPSALIVAALDVVSFASEDAIVDAIEASTSPVAREILSGMLTVLDRIHSSERALLDALRVTRLHALDACVTIDNGKIRSVGFIVDAARRASEAQTRIEHAMRELKSLDHLFMLATDPRN